MQSFGLRAVGYADRSKARSRARAMSYSCSVKPVSRSGGRSATAAAAYRNAELILDQRTGERHDYTRRSGVEHVSWFAPAGCREQTSAELWNRAEAAEKRKNSTVAREVLAALPHELNQFQRRELVERMTAQLAGRYGVAGTAGIHAPDREGDQRNWHVHILMTTRRIDPATGELGAKTRELDDLKTGPAEVVWIRQMVEREGNAALERAGHAARLDCRSLADQGIDRAPTTHEGPRVTAIRRECEREQRDPLGACDVIELNDARRLPPLAELRAESQQLEAEIIDLSQRRQERALRREVGELGRALAEPEPRCIAVAKAQKRQVEQRLQDAKQWHQEHPIRSALSSWAGIEPRADREAEAAREAYNASEARREAIRWQEQRAKDQQRLQEARSELLEAPGVADAADRLENASRALRRAEGLSENHATRAVLDERAALHQERTQMRELRQEIEAARERVPTRAEAQELEQRAGQHLGRMEGWEQIEQQRQAEARQELERRAAESVRDRQEARQAGPRNGGPKLG
jgi:hypothetical protein